MFFKPVFFFDRTLVSKMINLVILVSSSDLNNCHPGIYHTSLHVYDYTTQNTVSFVACKTRFFGAFID